MYLGVFDGSNFKNLIMEYNPENEKCVGIGTMKTARGVIDFLTFLDISIM